MIKPTARTDPTNGNILSFKHSQHPNQNEISTKKLVRI